METHELWRTKKINKSVLHKSNSTSWPPHQNLELANHWADIFASQQPSEVEGWWSTFRCFCTDRTLLKTLAPVLNCAGRLCVRNVFGLTCFAIWSCFVFLYYAIVLRCWNMIGAVLLCSTAPMWRHQPHGQQRFCCSGVTLHSGSTLLSVHTHTHTRTHESFVLVFFSAV